MSDTTASPPASDARLSELVLTAAEASIGTSSSSSVSVKSITSMSLLFFGESANIATHKYLLSVPYAGMSLVSNKVHD